MLASMMSDIPDIISRANWGIVLGSCNWVYALCSQFGGYVADRFSRRHVIPASLPIWSAVTWWTGAIDTFEESIPARAVIGISEAV